MAKVQQFAVCQDSSRMLMPKMAITAFPLAQLPQEAVRLKDY